MKILVIMALLLSASTVLAGTRVEGGVRLWPAPDHTRLVLDTAGLVEHNVFSLSGPSRLVIDLKDAALGTDFSKVDLSGSPPIQRIRSAPRNGNDLRVVLDLKSDIKPRSFVLEPNQQYGHRLVVDLIDEQGSRLDRATSPTVTQDSAGKRDIIVVIDAGHGGEDPGAIGPPRGGTREKDVVLRMAKRLADLINQQKGFTAKLTRTGDYYVGLRNRTLLARKYNADLFVSVHADAFRTPQPRGGASVFALSQRGATSETARWLAQSENRSDLIGGAGGVSLDGRDDMLAGGVLLDLSMTASINASLGGVGDSVAGPVGPCGQASQTGGGGAGGICGFEVAGHPPLDSGGGRFHLESDRREESCVRVVPQQAGQRHFRWHRAVFSSHTTSRHVAGLGKTAKPGGWHRRQPVPDTAR